MPLEVIAIAQTAEEAEFIQRLLATDGIVSILNERDNGKPDFHRGDVNFVNFGEILVDTRALAQARELLNEYRQRLDNMRGLH